MVIINQDCLEWMATQPDNTIDIVVSSPPYNIGVGYNTYSDRKTDYAEWMHSVWNEACRILKPNGHLFLNIQPTRRNPLMPYEIVSGINWQIQNTFIWNKSIEIDGYVRGHGYAMTTSKHYIPNGWEYVFHLTLNGRTTIDLQDSGVPYQPEWAEANSKRTGRDWRPTMNTWFIPYETNGARSNKKISTGKKHPAVYPKALVRRCLEVVGAKPEHTVYDPFGGTGTTALAAQELGCKWIITEIDPDYCEFIGERLKKNPNAAAIGEKR